MAGESETGKLELLAEGNLGTGGIKCGDGGETPPSKFVGVTCG